MTEDMSQPNVAAAKSRPASDLSWREWMRSGGWEGMVDTALPMLPTLAAEVVRLALDSNASATRITTVVAKDPVLATRVVQLANSAFSAPAVEISSISEAIVRMGTRAVRNVVTAACLTSRFKDPRIYGSHGRDIMDHSVGTAYLARLIADRAGESPDEAFLYGLLHDIGKLLVLKLAHDFPRRSADDPSDEDVAALIVELHGELGGRLVRQWQLPRRLHDPLVWHHQPDRAEHDPRAAAVAYAANRLAHRYGFGCSRDDLDPLTDPVFASIGVDAQGLAQIDSHAPGLFEVARQIVH
jgi:HD-like signal output (HDOD) protein